MESARLLHCVRVGGKNARSLERGLFPAFVGPERIIKLYPHRSGGFGDGEFRVLETIRALILGLQNGL